MSGERPSEFTPAGPVTHGWFCPDCQANLAAPDGTRCPDCERDRPTAGWNHDGLLGQTIVGGQYRVLRRLGAGGFGVVYEVETVVGGLRRACKVLLDRWARDPDVSQRFVNEAVLLEQINHPNVARCFAAGKLADGGALYLLFELIDGISVAELLAAGADGSPRPLAPLRAVRIARQVAAGLVAAHARKILHRDLKPGNIMVTAPGTAAESVKLLDFGVAKILEADRTATDAMVGTPDFMAPEQVLPGLPVGTPVDLWQLGATLFAMLTGRPPYPAAERAGKPATEYFAPGGEPGPLPSLVNPALAHHPALDRLVSQLLATSPADRPDSATRLCEEFARIERDLNPDAAATRPALLDALCAQPSPGSWTALCRYLTRQPVEVRAQAAAKLADWPTELRRASLVWWEEIKRGEPHPLWDISQSLDLANRGLSDDDVARLAASPAAERIRRLDLSGNAITAAGVAALAASPHLASLEALDLAGDRLGADAVEALVRSPHLRRLRRLGLADNRIGDRGLEQLLAADLRLHDLDLADNDLRAAGTDAFSHGGLKELQRLNLAGNGLGPHAAAMLAVSPLLGTLRELDLSDNTVGPGGAAALAVSKGLGRLQTLRLARNGLGRQGLQLLLASSGFESLQTLDVASNELGPNGALALASAPIARRLRDLDLADNGIEDAGLAALLGAPQLTGLVRLGVAQNALTASGVGLLDGAALQVDSLDLSDNALGGKGASLLAVALGQMRLRELRLRRTELDGETLAAVIAGGRGALRVLVAGANALGVEGARRLAQVPETMSLVELELDATWQGPDGLAALAASPHLGNLRRLLAGANACGDAALAALQTGTAWPSLEQLELPDSGIGAAGAAALAASPLAPRLRRLELAYNRLGDAGVEALAHGPGWHQLEYLGLRSNDIGLAGAATLMAAEGLEMLQSLDLGDNPLLGELDVHGLTADEATLMEETFAAVSADPAGFAERFYGELFQRFPGVKPLFAHVSMRRQQRHLYDALALVIENLRNPDEVHRALVDLGRRHVGYGVSPSHYTAVTSTLLGALRDTLGEEWTDSVQDAWADGLEAIARVMMSAHREDRARQGRTGD